MPTVHLSQTLQIELQGCGARLCPREREKIRLSKDYCTQGLTASSFQSQVSLCSASGIPGEQWEGKAYFTGDLMKPVLTFCGVFFLLPFSTLSTLDRREKCIEEKGATLSLDFSLLIRAVKSLGQV